MLVDRGQLERDIRLLGEQGDTSAAVALVIRGYGPEILGFLHAIRKNQRAPRQPRLGGARAPHPAQGLKERLVEVGRSAGLIDTHEK